MKDKTLEERLNISGKFSEVYARLREDKKVPIEFKEYVADKLTSYIWWDETHYFTRLTSYEFDERTKTVRYQALGFQTGYCSDRGEERIGGEFKQGLGATEIRHKFSAKDLEEIADRINNPTM